jgi:hypothetical protein
VASNDDLYYTSSLTQEAIDREKAAPTAAAWTKPKKLPVAQLYNAKGVAFCGDKYSKEAPEGGKYGQLFVAEQGDDVNNGRVVGWEVVADAADPAAIKLQNPWDVYAPNNAAAPTDVKCGPKDGLFIADKGNKGVFWVTNADLKAKQANPAYQTVISAADCGDAAVANVRSLAYDPVEEKLSWSNNDEAVVENSGVFEVDQPATGVVPVFCKAKCDAWSRGCTGNVKKVGDSEAGEKAWAVASAWGGVQVSKGDGKVYSTFGKVVADVPREATYAVAAQDPRRDVLLVSDAQEGAVYTAKQGSAVVFKIADVPEAYGVAYNNAWGSVADAAPAEPPVDAACLGKFAKGVSDCSATFIKCTGDAGSDSAKTCSCFQALIKCTSALTPCTTPVPSFTITAEQKRAAVQSCAVASKCTEAQCEALLTDTDTDNDKGTNTTLAVVVPIVVVGVLLYVLGGAIAAFVALKHQRAKQAQAAATQEAAITSTVA